jgi:hypothetical protein
MPDYDWIIAAAADPLLRNESGMAAGPCAGLCGIR